MYSNKFMKIGLAVMALLVLSTSCKRQLKNINAFTDISWYSTHTL